MDKNEKTAWDLDGVFLHDVPSEIFERDLEAALAVRDTYPIADFAPVPEPCDFIITGRPVVDKERTLRWMESHGIYNPLFLRDDGIDFPTKEEIALWKGQKALELGCTHYVESDPIQSIHIANAYPELRVIWWNLGDPISLHAKSQKQLHTEVQI